MMTSRSEKNGLTWTRVLFADESPGHSFNTNSVCGSQFFGVPYGLNYLNLIDVSCYELKINKKVFLENKKKKEEVN